jgi:hypothetical protein
MVHITFTIRNIIYTHSDIFKCIGVLLSITSDIHISSIRTNPNIYPLVLEITSFICLVSLIMLESHYTTM